jgi:hypothetical protein
MAHPDRSHREPDPRLTAGMATIVIALLSLGLWWITLAAFSSLAPMLPK